MIKPIKIQKLNYSAFDDNDKRTYTIYSLEDKEKEYLSFMKRRKESESGLVQGMHDEKRKMHDKNTAEEFDNIIRDYMNSIDFETYSLRVSYGEEQEIILHGASDIFSEETGVQPEIRFYTKPELKAQSHLNFCPFAGSGKRIWEKLDIFKKLFGKSYKKSNFSEPAIEAEGLIYINPPDYIMKTMVLLQDLFYSVDRNKIEDIIDLENELNLCINNDCIKQLIKKEHDKIYRALEKEMVKSMKDYDLFRLFEKHIKITKSLDK